MKPNCLRECKSVIHPAGVTIIAVLTFYGAAAPALSSAPFYFVAVMGMASGDPGEPVSVAIAGMRVAGGISLLILAGAAAGLALAWWNCANGLGSHPSHL
jgi:hypothetical protein